MTKYTFVQGWSPNLDPQIAGKTLAAIAKQYGCITPKTVVDDSRPAKAPLHDYFQWDDQQAAESFRLDQAAKLIRCVRVVSEERTDGEDIVHRPFIRINATTEHEAGYYPAAVVMSHADMRQQAIGDAIAHLSRAKERLKEYRELEREYAAIEAVEEKVQKKQARLIASAGKNPAHASV